MNVILLHYDEIGLKGKNREQFERRLIQNLQEKIQRLQLSARVKRMYGRLRIEYKDDVALPHILESTATTFGIANISPATMIEPTIQKISETAEAALRNEEPFASFRMTVKRSGSAPLTSKGIAEDVGTHIVTRLRKIVNLNHPDQTCWIEVADNECFVSTKKIAGPGGLPVGVSGTGVVLLSGGIDSPVAGWYAMKRGLVPIYLHFHSYPFTKNQSIEKAAELKNILDRFHLGSLFLCPFGEIQREIFMKAPDRYRVILYRRMMMRIAERFANTHRAKTLVTGEALGQVASQTIENIGLTNAVVTLPVLRPLIGFDKKEIIEKARQINTYETSILPHEDCCTLFAPKQPETHGKKEEVEEIEKELDVERMVKEGAASIENFEILKF